MEEKKCSICQGKINPGFLYVECEKCNKSYHKSCWDQTERCVTSWCDGKALTKKLSSESDRSDVAASDLENDFDKELRLYLDENSDFYLKCFRKIRSQNQKLMFHSAALIFGPLWLLYRKLYWQGYLFLAASILPSLLGIGIFSALIVRVLLTLFGTYMYYCKANKDINAVKDLPAAERSKYYKKHGGTGTLHVFIAIFIVAALWCIENLPTLLAKLVN